MLGAFFIIVFVVWSDGNGNGQHFEFRAYTIYTYILYICPHVLRRFLCPAMLHALDSQRRRVH